MKVPKNKWRHGPKYPVGSQWTVKGNKWLIKNELVVIRKTRKKGKDREVFVDNFAGRQGWISVKKLKKRVA